MSRIDLDHFVVDAPRTMPDVSVVVLLGSRHGDLRALCQSLRRALMPETASYELLLIDEGTGPDTRALVRVLMREFSETRAIRLRRPMGESAALAIAANAARAPWLLILDPYLHVAVEDLPTVLAPLHDGADLVCVWRSPRQEGGLSRAASTLFNALARRLTGVAVHDLNCRTRAMRTTLLRELPVYGDLHRFLPIFAARRGYVWREVRLPQQPGKRELGAFQARSYVQRFFDLMTLAFLTRFVKRPLHFFGILGTAVGGAGAVLAMYLAYERLIQGYGIGHRPLLLLAALLIVVGVQIASTGLLGEIMIFTHARDLQDYVVQEERGA